MVYKYRKWLLPGAGAGGCTVLPVFLLMVGIGYAVSVVAAMAIVPTYVTEATHAEQWLLEFHIFKSRES